MYQNLHHYFNHLTDPQPIWSWLKYDPHEKNISKSKKLLVKIRNWKLPQVLSYLRKIDPYLFEELVLTTFNEQGYRIIRNESYSGDGGLDGMVYLKGRPYLIQAKRYKSFINTLHVHKFAELVNKHEKVAGGFFIHTGKTPVEAKRVLKSCQDVSLISGQKLVDLLKGQLKIE